VREIIWTSGVTGLEDEVCVNERHTKPERTHLPKVAGAPEGGPEDEDHNLDERDCRDGFADHD
jgi:hypothetical protein